ncbi:hypothetical protein E2C01_057492 [Portunus trituberculatus]|uniref:Uncharacterized protein n=1 Tax=Portunus trituberculatus TaxID=210409 RepID=A0A5B7H3H6_PORTR|nr:hypothetical protein [Portunus trituberculatus]
MRRKKRRRRVTRRTEKEVKEEEEEEEEEEKKGSTAELFTNYHSLRFYLASLFASRDQDQTQQCRRINQPLTPPGHTCCCSMGSAEGRGKKGTHSHPPKLQTR